jgi:hypothetical protein
MGAAVARHEHMFAQVAPQGSDQRPSLVPLAS